MELNHPLTYLPINSDDSEAWDTVYSAVDEIEKLEEAFEIMKALGGAYDVGQEATPTSAIGRYRKFMVDNT